MTSQELARLMKIARKLPFVAEIDTMNDEKLVIVTWVSKLARNLPVSRAILSIRASEFSVEAVKEGYQHNVIDYLTSTLKLAEELQQTAEKVKVLET